MIALDVMGGDKAPQETIKGALLAAREGASVLLCGPRQLIIDELAAHDSGWQSYALEICDADQVIEMGEEPLKAIQSKPRSSLMTALAAVKQGKVQAAVSAGNTGAWVVGAMFVLGRDAQMERPAIAGFLPTKKQPVLCLDLGASSDCRSYHLVQFAYAGSDYLRKVRSLKHPRIGLLANGSEASKGSLLIKETHTLLRETCEDFIGNVEPADVFKGDVDLDIVDGFTGNIFLKTIEAVSEVHSKRLFQRSFDWTAQGGAILLGVQGIVIVAHGCSHAEAIKNAIFCAQSSFKQKK